jgi:hypothetical protein
MFLRNTRSGCSCAMLCPVMVYHANRGFGMVAAVRRAKSSGPGLPLVACPRSLCVLVTQWFHICVPSCSSRLPSQFLLFPFIRPNPAKTGHRKRRSRPLVPCSSFLALPTRTFQLSASAPARPLRLRDYLVFFPFEPIRLVSQAARSQSFPRPFNLTASPNEPNSFPVSSISSAFSPVPIHPNKG